MATTTPAAVAPTVIDVPALASTITNVLYSALQAKTLNVTAVLAESMCQADTLVGLSGAQKKAVVLAALNALADRAAQDTTLSTTVRNVATTCDALIDLAVSASKATSPADTLDDASSLFTAFRDIQALVQTARGNGSITAASVAALLPGIVQALATTRIFVVASATEQTTLATELIHELAETAPTNEQAAWSVAESAVAPIVFAVQAAKSGTLNINTVTAAIEANPEAAMNFCMSCFAALLAAFAKK